MIIIVIVIVIVLLGKVFISDNNIVTVVLRPVESSEPEERNTK